jgi:flavin-dependent dehydrogenase
MAQVIDTASLPPVITKTTPSNQKNKADRRSDLGLHGLQDGDIVCIVGGGPAGASCAIALRNYAARLGRDITVIIYEQKRFEEFRQHNQCIGVLSPPLEDILHKQLDLRLPSSIILKEMDGYCLHSDLLDVPLDGEENGRTYAVNRTAFDAFMLNAAQDAGAHVLNYRVTDVEFAPNEVVVYSEGENCHAAVIVGAFGLDDGSCKALEQVTPYRSPDFLSAVITRLYPGQEFLDRIGPIIHAFLLSLPGVEFGAVTPKHDHLAINVAGRQVTSTVMMDFLRSPPVQRFLPPHQRRAKPLHYFKGKFPTAPARNLFGDRYVTVGDAAGLIRPFKGKGINSACLTGIRAADCMLNRGVSKAAFESYVKNCAELTGDYWYGRSMRWLINQSTRLKFTDRLLKIAKRDPLFMECLFNSVSGHLAYKQIVKKTLTPSLVATFLEELTRHFVLRRPVHTPLQSHSAPSSPTSVPARLKDATKA